MSGIYQIGAKLLLVALLSITTLSCQGNPSHSLPIKGTIDIEVTPDGIICFQPNIDNVTFAGEPYDDLNGITDVYVIIYSTWDAEYKDQFSVISDKEKVCITEDSFDFEKKLYKRLVHGSPYNLIISGKTDDYKHRVRLTNEFYYP